MRGLRRPVRELGSVVPAQRIGCHMDDDDEPIPDLNWYGEALYRRVLTASANMVEWSTVPIAGDVPDEYTDFKATGVLLQIGEYRFLVTASHVLEPMEQLNERPFILPTRPDRNAALIAGKTASLKASALDLAVCLLDDRTCEAIEGDYRFLRMSNVWQPSQEIDSDPLFLITGFPAESRETVENAITRVKIFRYFAVLYRGELTNVENFAPLTELVLHYERTGRTAGGDILRNPKVGGMSGCGVWAVTQPEALVGWNADNLKLAAIQRSWHPAHRYLRATKMNVLLNLIRDSFPATREVLKMYGI